MIILLISIGYGWLSSHPTWFENNFRKTSTVILENLRKKADTLTFPDEVNRAKRCQSSNVASISFFLAYGPFNHIVIKGVLKRACSKKGAVPVFLREASQNLQNCLTADLHEFIRGFPKRQFGGKRAAHHAGPAAIR